ncbi:MAG: hypothetical protein VKO65_01090 [Cyanobacteriota bacterium]|nr:hypothetical protein [Cyanobacteriota bacterium]
MLLRRLLLLPLLSPLLAALVVGALNPAPALSLRLLTWRSPALPIGLWIAGAAAGGAALSGGATALALGEAGAGLRRRVRRRQEGGWAGDGASRFQRDFSDEREPWERLETDQRRDTGRSSRPGRSAPAWGGGSAGPERPPGEPPPTVEVPFRVLRRGAAAPAEPVTAGRSDRIDGRERIQSPRQAEQEPVAVAINDDWALADDDSW